MQSHFKPLAALLLAAAMAACSSAQNSGPAAPRNLSVLTHDQLVVNHFQNAYDAIAALRSNWLNKRGMDSFTSPSQIMVYFDNVRLGSIDALRSVATTSIAYMRHYDGIEATSRWGLDHGAGVIYISTRSDLQASER